MTEKLTHLNAAGEARMVDVSEKARTSREAVAEGFVVMAPATLDLCLSGQAKKGDVFASARIAGIFAAKKTHELIPLCHPLAAVQGRGRADARPRPARPAGAGARRKLWARPGWRWRR